MRLRVPFFMAIPGLWTFVLMETLGVAQGPSNGAKPVGKPLDYILSRLHGVMDRTLSTDFLEDSRLKGFSEGVTFSSVDTLSDCSWRVKFDSHTKPEEKNGVVSVGAMTIGITLTLSDVELGGVAPKGNKVSLRMLKPAQADKSSQWVFSNGNKIDPGDYSVEVTMIFLPAIDATDAARLARALEQQVRICGGKRDPYAQPPPRGSASVGAQRTVK